MYWLRLISLSAIAFIALPAQAQDRAKVQFDWDIPYCKLPDDKELKMDIAYPNGKGPYPAIVCVHGGAWRFGSRKDISGWIQYLAGQGYVAASVSYRLLPDGRFPEPLVDCKTAVRFLRANSDKFHVNKDRIGAMGFSAGGHLVCLLGTANKNAAFEGKQYTDQSSKVQAVVSYFGPTDLSLYGQDESAQNAVFQPLLGARYKDKPDIYRNASPITYASKDAPPILFLHGTKDWIVPIEHSRVMYNKLKEANAPAEILEIEGGAHGFEGTGAAKANDAMLKFFDKALKK